ncbi:hypothetical protein [Moritella sp. F3]|uniref:hypothetical protein n=1 Tax=Moritella sp. F3 TaxID=2718882 RepID=UPI0018E1891D|nr:hypothetical protein [Moritella sp. F3]GIC77619.1 hypothetical protein FMO001_23460 [Moritella sp. F1]GIC82032.1 hypothetical protein FMO003_23130 [Moritella sp. F3]
MTNTTIQNKTDTSNPDTNIVTAKSDIAVLISNPDEIVLQILNEPSMQDICDDAFGKIEDYITSSVSEISSDEVKFNQAVDLLNANGLGDLGNILNSLVEGNAALNWLKENHCNL